MPHGFVHKGGEGFGRGVEELMFRLLLKSVPLKSKDWVKGINDNL